MWERKKPDLMPASLVALGGYNVDLIAGIFGGADSLLSRVVYGLVGISALYQLGPSIRVLRGQRDETNLPEAR